MQQPIPADASSSSAAGFAGLLSALIAPTQKPVPKADDGWNDDGLVDDFATLSYERAMRSHARYHASEFEDQIQADVPKPVPAQSAEAFLEEDPPLLQAQSNEGFFEEDSPLLQAISKAVAESKARLASEKDWPESERSRPDSEKASIEPEMDHRKVRPLERHRKNASITIRMSQAEYEQLHARAAEAGLTVSAYLRSCTFEAESLRAQVKETLAQLRAGNALEKRMEAPKEKQPVAPKSSSFKWLSPLKFMRPHSHANQYPVRA